MRLEGTCKIDDHSQRGIDRPISLGSMREVWGQLQLVHDLNSFET
jgi:hypothetical protein